MTVERLRTHRPVSLPLFEASRSDISAYDTLQLMPSRRTRQLVPWWTFPIQYLQRAFPTAILSGRWLSSLSIFVPVSIFLSICPSVYLPVCMPVCQAPILSLFLIHWRIGIWLEIYYCCLVNGDRSGRASDDRERARGLLPVAIRRSPKEDRKICSAFVDISAANDPSTT